ncbi:unnamed protein product, partial [Meganyctiphanes norvegica]
GCGKQGEFIQLGADFLEDAVPGEAASRLLGEWAKFRWGVFDQRGYEGDPLYPGTFRDPTTGDEVPNVCSATMGNTSMCASEGHTPEAPTKHNVQCHGRSAWEVISQSQDIFNR